MIRKELLCVREETCCFTGHRKIKDKDFDMVMARTMGKVRELIVKYGYRYFRVGGSIGYDMFAAEILFLMRDLEFPHIQVILDYPFDGFTDGWDEEQKNEYAKLLPQYDKIVCVSPSVGREAYLARDRHLIDNSSFCISYCTRRTGGTAYTIRYAETNHIPVYNTVDFDISLV